MTHHWVWELRLFIHEKYSNTGLTSHICGLLFAYDPDSDIVYKTLKSSWCDICKSNGTDSGLKSTLSFSLCCLESWVSWASAPKQRLDKIHDKVRSDEKSWMYHCIYFNVIDISCGSLAGHCCWAVSSLWLYFGSIDREMQERHNVSVTGQIWATLNLTLFVYSRRSQSFHKQLRLPVDRSDCQH